MLQELMQILTNKLQVVDCRENMLQKQVCQNEWLVGNRPGERKCMSVWVELNCTLKSNDYSDYIKMQCTDRYLWCHWQVIKSTRTCRVLYEETLCFILVLSQILKNRKSKIIRRLSSKRCTDKNISYCFTAFRTSKDLSSKWTLK